MHHKRLLAVFFRPSGERLQRMSPAVIDMLMALL